MLKDRYFYPLAVIVIAAMVFAALLPGTSVSLDEEEILRTGLVLEGEALSGLGVSPGSQLVFQPDNGTDPDRVLVFTDTPRNVGPPAPGIVAYVSEDYEQAFAGRELRVTIRARAVSDTPLDEFEMRYYTLEGGPRASSGWRKFPLTGEWEEHSFLYAPPIIPAPPASDLLAIWAGVTGEQKKMEIARISMVPTGRTLEEAAAGE